MVLDHSATDLEKCALGVLARQKIDMSMQEAMTTGFVLQ